jgi:hypothetical protein
LGILDLLHLFFCFGNRPPTSQSYTNTKAHIQQWHQVPHLGISNSKSIPVVDSALFGYGQSWSLGAKDHVSLVGEEEVQARTPPRSPTTRAAASSGPPLQMTSHRSQDHPQPRPGRCTHLPTVANHLALGRQIMSLCFFSQPTTLPSYSAMLVSPLVDCRNRNFVPASDRIRGKVEVSCAWTLIWKEFADVRSFLRRE